MDTRLSCLIRGIIGVIFGLLALLFPNILLLETLYVIFWILIGLGIAGFLFLAITSRSDESLFWFSLSAGLLIIGVLSFLVQPIVAIIFLLIIAGIAFYNGFSDITLALKHPRTKYFLIPGMFVAGAALLFGLLYYFPSFLENLVIVTLGSFAFVFGLFSIVMGYYHAEEPKQDVSEIKWDPTCQDHKHQGKK
jgi:uncharacterized membrane protein HdeD (DUF308 family)